MPTRANDPIADDTDLAHAGESAACNALVWDRIAGKYAADPIADMPGYENALRRIQSLLSADHDVVEFGCGSVATPTALTHARPQEQRSGWGWLEAWRAYIESVGFVLRIDRSKRWRRVLVYLLRGLTRPADALQWAHSLKAHVDAATLVIHPRLVLKPYRRYMNRHLGWKDRTAIIVGHYREEVRLISSHVLDRLALGRPVTFWHQDAESASALLFALERTDRFDREGELLLSLYAGDRCTRVMSTAFSISRHRGELCLYVGCIQGSSDDSAQTHIRVATRASHGIRPKNLVMDGLAALARSIGASKIVCSGNGARVFQSSSVHADYDAFWKELGGQPGPNDIYVLPNTVAHRDPALVASRKRAEYRRRQDLRASVTEAVRTLVRNGQESRR